MKPLPYPVVLASASPRRQELLRSLIQDFIVVAADIDEDALTIDDPYLTAQRLSREKALAIFEKHSNSLVIAGDTVVALESCQLAKPKSPEDAARMLRALSGRTHRVITGVALRWPKGMTSFTDQTKVTFRELIEAEIDSYVASGEPMDKAGAYAIQSKAMAYVSKVEGSVNNVIGLPTERLLEALREIV